MPDELDPQIREFTSQLRRLVDRSELSIASVADATGYSKTSWERYLNGRLLAPKGAIVALAEVTGTDPVHLTTMWELAERAWSRSEMRHDMTMEAIRISQARAALGEAGAPAGKAGRASGPDKAGRAARAGGADGAGEGGRNVRPGKSGRHAGGGPSSGVAGPAGVAPTLPPSVPAQPTAADSPDSALGPVRGGGASDDPSVPSSDAPSPGGATDGNSWGLAGYRGPSPTGDRTPRHGSRTGAAEPAGAPGAEDPAAAAGHAFPNGQGPADPYGSPGPGDAYGGPGSADPYGYRPGPATAYGRPPHDGPRAGGRPSGGGGKRMATFVAGVVGVLVVIAGAFFLLNQSGDKDDEGAKPSPSPTVSKSPELPPGVQCSGDACTGKDPEVMGCGGDLVTTGATAAVGTASVEVRYSKVCGAAWARVTQAAQGDEVQVKADGENEQRATVGNAGDTVAYTAMVAADSAADATACVTLASGQQGCTEK
ncbi:helix-turn-helix domain-containing protein [Streptomyces olivaceus]|uniref:helix-turn-helix domain-containing protein n=1 Tax=Streptomyces olivaceus TaxID=47716 RepID=UPI001CCA53DF|nr:XRE family transcriptional regulator [Streptomyces olivaceus]